VLGLLRGYRQYISDKTHPIFSFTRLSTTLWSLSSVKAVTALPAGVMNEDTEGMFV